jgi:hypothetical protein
MVGLQADLSQHSRGQPGCKDPERKMHDKIKKMKKMIGNIANLGKMWNGMDACYKRPEKYILDALRPVTELKQYKVSDSAAIR